MKSWDLELIRLVQSLPDDGFRYGFVPFALMGSVEVTIPIVFLLSAWLYKRREYQKAYLCLASLLLALAVGFFLKRTFVHLAPPLEFRGRFPVEADTISVRTAFSYPSGHLLRVSAICGLLGYWFPAMHRQFARLMLVLVCFLSALAMVYYGFHWPSDVIGGSLLGLFAAETAHSLTSPKPSRS